MYDTLSRLKISCITAGIFRVLSIEKHGNEQQCSNTNSKYTITEEFIMI